ncbi:MAG TPA: hypothetical protein VEM93_09925, partial [Actinomycetota bacterium]|nr:hypothetical protein [Actinomycetota bacterium]
TRSRWRRPPRSSRKPAGRSTRSSPRRDLSAVGSQVVGLAFYRYVPKVEPIASASPETVCSIFGPTLQRYLTGPLNLPPSGKAG